MSRRQAISWMALLAAVLAASELLDRIRFPASSMISRTGRSSGGMMLLTMAVILFGLSHGYAPTHLFKQLLFALIGFEVGIRFTRAVVVQMARLILGMTVAVVALSGLVAAAEGMNANMPLITGVQSVRLVLMVVMMLPIVVRVLRWWAARPPGGDVAADGPVGAVAVGEAEMPSHPAA